MASQKHTYELTYIVNSVLNDRQTKDVVKRVNRAIEDHGGEIIEVDEWGTRRLAYPIKKRRNGYYVNMYFRASGELVERLERLMNITDNILRYLTLRMDQTMLRQYEQRKQKEQLKAEQKAAESEDG